MARGRELTLTTRERNGAVEVVLAGVITERVDMAVPDVPSGKRVLVDVGAVAGINSFGVRTWVNFLSALCERSQEVTIQRLPPVLVSQACMVANFLGEAKVESFFSPWCCLDCDSESLRLHRIDAELPRGYPCAECDGEMEFDGLRDSYLSFRTDVRR